MIWGKEGGPSGAPQGLRIIPGEAGGRDLSDGLVLVAMEAGTWEAPGNRGATWPDLTHPSPVEPLSGNLVEKNCSGGARPRTASRAKSA